MIGNPSIVDCTAFALLLLFSLLIMMKGHKVSEDLAWTIVHMAPLLEPSEIAGFTSVSEWQQRRILSLWRNTGEVVQHRDRRVKGRPRHLTPNDVVVCVLHYPLHLYLKQHHHSIYREHLTKTVMHTWMSCRKVFKRHVELTFPLQSSGGHSREVDTA